MIYVLVAAAPALGVVSGLVAGIAKDGSPFRRSWWTS